MRKTIAVAMATYNGGRFLEQQLDSIVAQTVLPDFISVSDDCSTDETVSILQAFQARTDIPMALNFNREQVGVLKNFNKAFDQCRTDYISYCDQDDVWMPNKLASYRAILEEKNVALVFHKSKVVDADLNEIARSEPFNVRSGCYKFPHLPDYIWGFGHQMIFSNAVYGKLKEIQRSMYPEVAAIGANLDRALLLAAGMVGDIYFIDENLINFRRHGWSVSTAGKNPKAAPLTSDVDARFLAISRHWSLVAEVLKHVASCEGADTPSGVAYASHAEKILEVYGRRLDIYSGEGLLNRIGALTKIAFSGAYGDVLRNGIPIRHLILDAARAFRP